MSQSDLRFSVIRILKTATGPVGRALMRRGRSLPDNARSFFHRDGASAPVPELPPPACAVLSRKADRAGGPGCRRIVASGFSSLSALALP